MHGRMGKPRTPTIPRMGKETRGDVMHVEYAPTPHGPWFKSINRLDFKGGHYNFMRFRINREHWTEPIRFTGSGTKFYATGSENVAGGNSHSGSRRRLLAATLGR